MAEAQKLQFKAIIATDSRGREFENFASPNQEVYETVYIVKRGGKVHNVGEDILTELAKITHETVVIIIFGAGINNCTLKLRHFGGTEIVPLTQTSVLNEIRKVRLRVHAAHPNTLFDVATIPMIHLAHSNKFAAEHNQLWATRFTDEQHLDHQIVLSENVGIANKGIIELNNTPQSLAICGVVRSPQLYWHQKIERDSYKRSQLDREKKRQTKRISWNATVDGVHATEEIAVKWYNTAHDNILKCCKSIQAIYNLKEWKI